MSSKSSLPSFLENFGIPLVSDHALCLAECEFEFAGMFHKRQGFIKEIDRFRGKYWHLDSRRMINRLWTKVMLVFVWSRAFDGMVEEQMLATPMGKLFNASGF